MVHKRISLIRFLVLMCFLQSYIEMVPRNTMPGSFITWLSASDEDTDQNADISYSLSASRPEDAGFFQVHSSSGAVTLVKMLDKVETEHSPFWW